MRPDDRPYTVRLAEIPPEGLVRAWDLSGDFTRMALEGTEANADASRLRTELRFDKQEREVYVHGSLVGEIALVCSRCLGPAVVPVDEELGVMFVPRGGENDRRDRDGDDEDAIELEAPDVMPYDDEVIDVGEMLREETLLALPMAPLCRDACKGLCGVCGKDWNEGPCACSQVVEDDRWAALKTVKIKES